MLVHNCCLHLNSTGEDSVAMQHFTNGAGQSLLGPSSLFSTLILLLTATLLLSSILVDHQSDIFKIFFPFSRLYFAFANYPFPSIIDIVLHLIASVVHDVFPIFLSTVIINCLFFFPCIHCDKKVNYSDSELSLSFCNGFYNVENCNSWKC